ncbi:MAG TPA: endolytic transglycosylase MltG [Spirochaetales bacterium]|nr:endolytic transglycosylase MltG [Spirochaetales bacterium]
MSNSNRNLHPGKQALGRKNAKAIIVVTLALLVCSLALFFFSAPPRKDNRQTQLVKIRPGISPRQVGSELQSAGVIRSAFFFNLYIKISGIDREIKAGNYRFPVGATMVKVASMLRDGDTAKAKVVIPEGFLARQIGQELEKAGVCSQTSFLTATRDKDLIHELGLNVGNLEGFLFPDTYYFDIESEPGDVVRKMVANFVKTISGIVGNTENLGSAKNLGSKEFYDKLILASIVEREYRVPSEAKLIASVFNNRLKIGMALQSCATVVYVITEKLGKPHPELVTHKDLTIPDAYNTYLHPGLPPGPICNPGKVALDAVFNPIKSQYLYFRLLSNETGQHRFSRTFDEHVQAVIPVKGY